MCKHADHRPPSSAPLPPTLVSFSSRALRHTPTTTAAPAQAMGEQCGTNVTTAPNGYTCFDYDFSWGAAAIGLTVVAVSVIVLLMLRAGSWAALLCRSAPPEARPGLLRRKPKSRPPSVRPASYMRRQSARAIADEFNAVATGLGGPPSKHRPGGVVRLRKGGAPLGIGIQTIGTTFQVQQVAEGGSAALSGKVHPGMQLLEVNDIETEDAEAVGLDEVMDELRSCEELRLVLQLPLSVRKDGGQLGIGVQEDPETGGYMIGLVAPESPAGAWASAHAWLRRLMVRQAAAGCSLRGSTWSRSTAWRPCRPMMCRSRRSCGSCARPRR